MRETPLFGSRWAWANRVAPVSGPPATTPRCLLPSYASALDQRQRSQGRAGGALELEGDADEGEGEQPVASQFFQVEVLNDVDPFLGEQVGVGEQRGARLRVAFVG